MAVRHIDWLLFPVRATISGLAGLLPSAIRTSSLEYIRLFGPCGLRPQKIAAAMSSRGKGLHEQRCNQPRDGLSPDDCASQYLSCLHRSTRICNNDSGTPT